MSPYARFIWTLLAALLIWSPVALRMFTGYIDTTIGWLLFLGALVLTYLATGIIDLIMGNYRRTQDHANRVKMQIELLERKAQAQAAADAAEQKRRVTDT